MTPGFVAQNKDTEWQPPGWQGVLGHARRRFQIPGLF